ncbi:syndecan-4 [Brachyhypopomus gauderio]|uniref:syndecan-4 n=1 Tax=Brachyhypopomus gauderio TaxID=698409 RepID=UPI004042E7D4
MLKVYLLSALLAAAVFAESVRETETWMPLKAVEPHDINGSGDFAFLDEESPMIDEDLSDYDDDDDDYEGMSGSGDEKEEDEFEISNPGLSDNRIPEMEIPIQPQDDEDHKLVRENEVGHSPSVFRSQAADNIFKKTEVLAAVIAGGAVGLLFAVLLILLLVYCLKKKDEGSYDLGKKPIYKKAPTTEIYA